MHFQRRDEWIKDRIHMAARKNDLPFGRVALITSWAQVPDLIVPLLWNAGEPVLLALVDTDNWSVLGTRQIVASTEARIWMANLGSIAGVDYPQQAEAGIFDALIVSDRSGESRMVPVGSKAEFFALFNILLRLMNLHAPRGEGRLRPAGMLDDLGG